MLRKLAAAGAAIGTLLVATLAQAQEKAGEFGEQGQFIFGADRLFPLFAYTNNTYNNIPPALCGGGPNGPSCSYSTTGTSLSFFYGSNTVSGGFGQAAFGTGNPTFYTPPRLGFDYTIIPHLTIGGEVIAFFTLGGSTSVAAAGTTVSNDSPSGNTFGIAPRVGYILGMNDMISFWLRGGFSYYNGNWSQKDTGCGNGTSGNDSANINVFGLDLDPQVVISPVQHFAFMAGPALDWGFAGGASYTTPNRNGGGLCNSGTTTTSAGYNAVNVSLTGGLLGWW